MIKPPEFTQIKDRHGKPLVAWDNSPGLMVELYADQLRELAKALTDAADKLDERERPRPNAE